MMPRSGEALQRGLVFDIKRYSIHDGPGIRTTVHLQGCPLSCWWCHNPEGQRMTSSVHYDDARCVGCETCVETCPEHALELTPHGVVTDVELCRSCGECAEACPSLARQQVGRSMSSAEVLAELEKDTLFHDESGGGVTFSGGEPLAQPEFLYELLRGAGERGMHRAVDTSGLAREEILMRIASETDLFLFDLKVIDPIRHRKTTGVSNQPILENLRKLAAAGHVIRVRVPVIPKVSDDDENIDRAGELLCTVPGIEEVDLLPFHTSARDKHRKFELPWRMNDAGEIPRERMEELADRLERFGLRAKIGGETR